MRSGQESSGNLSICSLRPSPIVRGLLRSQRCVQRGGLHTLPGVEPFAFAFWSSVNRAPPGRPQSLEEMPKVWSKRVRSKLRNPPDAGFGSTAKDNPKEPIS